MEEIHKVLQRVQLTPFDAMVEKSCCREVGIIFVPKNHRVPLYNRHLVTKFVCTARTFNANINMLPRDIGNANRPTSTWQNSSATNLTKVYT